MPIADALIAELDHEAASTKALLVLVPEAKASFKPHARSMPLGELASHIADTIDWGVGTVQHHEFDVAPPGQPPIATPPFTTTNELLQRFDASAASFRAGLAGASDADLMAPWSLKKGGAVVFTMPRAVVLRSFIFNHLYHHRGQLTVYLRMLGIALPGTYGPSADSPQGM